MGKFTFKREKGTWGAPDTYDIKIKGITVGYITAKIPYRTGIMATKSDINEDGNPNCPWKWVDIKHPVKSIEEVKKLLNTCFDDLNRQYNIFIDKTQQT